MTAELWRRQIANAGAMVNFKKVPHDPFKITAAEHKAHFSLNAGGWRPPIDGANLGESLGGTTVVTHTVPTLKSQFWMSPDVPTSVHFAA